MEVVVVYLTETLEPKDNDYPATKPVRAVIEQAYHQHYRGEVTEPIAWDKLTVTNVKGETVSPDAKLKDVDFAGSNRLLVVLKTDGGGGNTLTAVFLDPRVAHAKVKEQFELIRQAAEPRNWKIHKLEHPEAMVEVLPGVAVRIIARNYDFIPPSFTVVDPGTEVPLSLPEIRTRTGLQEIPNLLADHPLTRRPFFCVQGFWEYHEHPQHYNDPWLPYRKKYSLFSRLDLVDRLLHGLAFGKRKRAQ